MKRAHYRKAPPDFDIDWSWKERDVILDYIFNRYGADHVAFCGTNVECELHHEEGTEIWNDAGKVPESAEHAQLWDSYF